jgi:anti-sigma factor RsiW
MTMTCKQLVEWVTEYLEGALPAADRARFEEHLEECPGCRDYLAQFATTIRLTGRLPGAADGVPVETRRQLLRAFRELASGPAA